MAKARQQASPRPERPRKAGKVRRKPARKPAAAPKRAVRARAVSFFDALIEAELRQMLAEVRNTQSSAGYGPKRLPKAKKDCG